MDLYVKTTAHKLIFICIGKVEDTNKIYRRTLAMVGKENVKMRNRVICWWDWILREHVVKDIGVIKKRLIKYNVEWCKAFFCGLVMIQKHIKKETE